MGYLSYANSMPPEMLTINESGITPAAIEVLDRTAEFYDRNVSKDTAALTLRAWFDTQQLQDAAKHLCRFVTDDINPLDAIAIIVSTVYAARGARTLLSLCPDCGGTDGHYDAVNGICHVYEQAMADRETAYSYGEVNF